MDILRLLFLLSLAYAVFGCGQAKRSTDPVSAPTKQMMRLPEGSGNGVERWHKLYFQVGEHQTCLNETDDCKPDRNSIVEFHDKNNGIVNGVKERRNYIVVTPSYHGYISAKKFPKLTSDPYWDDRGFHIGPGMPAVFLDELLALESLDKEVVVIISKGWTQSLLISQPLKDTLEKKKGDHIIQDYYIEQTEKAVDLYNQFCGDGKRVFAFIHTTC